MRTITTGLCLVLFLCGCATYDPYTEDRQVSKATIGAAIGAGLGAIGAAIDNRGDDSRTRNQRVLAAAAAGGAIGGGVGFYMDRQEAKLRAGLRESGVQVVRDGDNLILVMPGNITFATGSASVKTDFRKVLSSVALVLAEFDKTILEVTGHTDSTGSDTFNLQLSERRAQSVAVVLQENEVAFKRILTAGLGESRPIADNNSDSGRSKNRRVELVLIPVTG
ncbi:MAG: outer membrane protein OmpA-like peptidoglycan-associated protein [Candidatus Azotimanducaceae bacterium]|jgi:outer membrane protein OmpA-like peptidoglycan-associated protein